MCEYNLFFSNHIKNKGIWRKMNYYTHINNFINVTVGTILIMQQLRFIQQLQKDLSILCDLSENDLFLMARRS